jgi:hypothetical protein
MKLYLFNYLIIASLLLVFLVSCDDDKTNNKTNNGTSVQLSGAVEKGPFVIGSSVSVNILDSDLNPTGSVFNTQTTSDLGEFFISFSTSSTVKLEGKGYYYNELSGELSGAELTLRALYIPETSGTQNAFINIITHLTIERIVFLVQNGETFSDATAIAEIELKNELAITIPTFELTAKAIEMNITGGDNNNNAYLLGVSSVLLKVADNREGDSFEAKVQELLNVVSLDLSDGTLQGNLKAEIATALLQLNTEDIQNKLSLRLAYIESSATVPDMDQVLDQDKDGVVNSEDNCKTTANADQANIDNDSKGDACDFCPDTQCDNFCIPASSINEETETSGAIDLCLSSCDPFNSDCDAGTACISTANFDFLPDYYFIENVVENLYSELLSDLSTEQKNNFVYNKLDFFTCIPESVISHAAEKKEHTNNSGCKPGLIPIRTEFYGSSSGSSSSSTGVCKEICDPSSPTACDKCKIPAKLAEIMVGGEIYPGTSLKYGLKNFGVCDDFDIEPAKIFQACGFRQLAENENMFGEYHEEFSAAQCAEGLTCYWNTQPGDEEHFCKKIGWENPICCPEELPTCNDGEECPSGEVCVIDHYACADGETSCCLPSGHQGEVCNLELVEEDAIEPHYKLTGDATMACDGELFCVPNRSIFPDGGGSVVCPDGLPHCCMAKTAQTGEACLWGIGDNISNCANSNDICVYQESEGAMCVAGAEIGELCSNDFPEVIKCLSHLACAAEYGTCVETGGMGEYCDSGQYLCEQGLACIWDIGINDITETCQSAGDEGQPCFDDNSCNNELVCIGDWDFQTCQSAGDEGQPCFDDNTCIDGLGCIEEMGIPTCRQAGGEAQPCFSDNTCDDPYLCALVNSENTCQTNTGGDGEYCFYDSSCNIGFSCNDLGICIAPGGAGAPCYFDETCDGTLECVESPTNVFLCYDHGESGEPCNLDSTCDATELTCGDFCFSVIPFRDCCWNTN